MRLPAFLCEADGQDRRRISGDPGWRFLPQRAAQQQEAQLAGPTGRLKPTGAVGYTAVFHHGKPPGGGPGALCLP